MDTKNSYTEKLEATVAKKKEELTAYEPYAPDEMFRFRGKDLFSVEDFWQYAYSKLDGMAETIADVMEVLYAMGKTCAVSKREVEQVRSQKAAEKGTFSKKIFLVSTEK